MPHKRRRPVTLPGAWHPGRTRFRSALVLADRSWRQELASRRERVQGHRAVNPGELLTARGSSVVFLLLHTPNSSQSLLVRAAAASSALIAAFY